MTRIRMLPTEPFGFVSPRLYGHFAEHLGRCCYDGLFTGHQSKDVPNDRGFRADVLDALKALPTPLLRWPGGCYADHYHWRDGIGSNRPARLGLSCGRRVLEDNSLGTDEFLYLCAQIGAEPYLAGNMGSGSVQELCDWVEYCNCEMPTALAAERAANGHPEPYGVKLWGIGNENWGCGGNYDPESYALEFRRYSLMVSDVDRSTEAVFCGHNTDWNQRAIEKMRNHINFIDHYSIHCYWIDGGPGTDFSEAKYYRLLDEASKTVDFVRETRSMLDEVSAGRKHIGIALDEWGVWHPEARTWGPDFSADGIGDYSQACTLRDALAIGVALEGFHQECQSLSLANLAQIVNVLHAPIMTEGDRMWLTPTYHALRLHACHRGATAYRVAVEGGEMLPDGGPAVSATATSGGVTVTNRHLHQPAHVVIEGDWESALLLAGDSPRDQNGPGHEDKVKLVPLAVTREGTAVALELPPHSMCTLKA